MIQGMKKAIRVQTEFPDKTEFASIYEHHVNAQEDFARRRHETLTKKWLTPPQAEILERISRLVKNWETQAQPVYNLSTLRNLEYLTDVFPFVVGPIDPASLAGFYLQRHGGLKKLPRGWDGDDAFPPTAHAWKMAENVLTTLFSESEKQGATMTLPDLAPTHEGGLHLRWEAPDWFLFISVPPDEKRSPSWHLRTRDRERSDGPFQFDRVSETIMGRVLG